MLKRNLIANYLGQGLTSLLGLAFVPWYVQYLGSEAYGLIGLFMILQAWFVLLDMGMSPTLGREMARFTAGAHSVQSIRELLRSMEVIVFTLAIVIALSIWASADWLATQWLKPDKLAPADVARALSVAALVIGLRFCEGIYRGALLGLQAQVWFNSANVVLAVLRHAGALVILAFVAPTIDAFFSWQAAISAISVATFAMKLHRLLPQAQSRVGFSLAAMRNVWRFAGGMLGINFLAFLLTQVDKIMLSRILNLEHFGYYTLAATIATSLQFVLVPITQAIFPKLVELKSGDQQAELSRSYHFGAQLVTVAAAPLACMMGLFSAGLLYAWTGNVTLARETAPILAPLALGTFLNGLMWMPYQLQLAHGWVGLTLKVNAVAVILLIPAILWMVPQYGAIAAAWIWVGLNAGYALLVIHFMHRRVLVAEQWKWYLQDVLVPATGCLLVGGLAWIAAQSATFDTRAAWAIYLIAVTGILYFVAAILARELRVTIMEALVRYRDRNKCAAT